MLAVIFHYIEQREYAKSMAEKDIHQWKKVITPLKEKQMTLCEVVLKLCYITILYLKHG